MDGCETGFPCVFFFILPTFCAKKKPIGMGGGRVKIFILFFYPSSRFYFPPLVITTNSTYASNSTARQRWNVSRAILYA